MGEARSRHTSAEVLNSLRRGVYRDFPNPSNDTRCPICLDDYNDSDNVLAMHPCSHFFHADCLQQWLQTSRSCPNCRARVTFRPPTPSATTGAEGTSSSLSAPLPSTSSGQSHSPEVASTNGERRPSTSSNATGLGRSMEGFQPPGLYPLPASAHASQTSSPTGSVSSINAFYESHHSSPPASAGPAHHPHSPIGSNFEQLEHLLGLEGEDLTDFSDLDEMGNGSRDLRRGRQP